MATADQKRVVAPDELAELSQFNTHIRDAYLDLGYREAQRRELAASMDALSAQTAETQREYDKAKNRILARHGVAPLVPGEPPKFAINLTTGEIISIDQIPK